MYMTISFVTFLINNPPKINQYYIEIDPNDEISAPQIAFNFYYRNGTNFSNFDNLTRYINFNLMQTTKYNDPNINSTDQKIQFFPCNSSQNISWMAKNHLVYYPNYSNNSVKKINKMKGILYSTDEYKYISL